MQKLLIIGISLLFLGSSVVAGFHTKSTYSPRSLGRGNWLYVGGSGPGNYTNIQDAINDSHDDDTVFMFDDSSPYYETIIIDHPISLIGENKTTTQIDGTPYKDIIQVYTNNFTMTGFTIQNGSIALSVNINNYTQKVYNILVFHNIFKFNKIGVTITSAVNVKVSNNIFYSNELCIEYNYIMNGSISRNYMINFTRFGIQLFADNNVTITQNTFMKSDTFGVRNAKFYYSSNLSWDLNFWNHARQLPKLILGRRYSKIFSCSTPEFQFDWHPAQQPYDIPQIAI